MVKPNVALMSGIDADASFRMLDHNENRDAATSSAGVETPLEVGLRQVFAFADRPGQGHRRLSFEILREPAKPDAEAPAAPLREQVESSQFGDEPKDDPPSSDIGLAVLIALIEIAAITGFFWFGH
jgi:hypothetical protein